MARQTARRSDTSEYSAHMEYISKNLHTKPMAWHKTAYTLSIKAETERSGLARSVEA